MDKQNVIDPMMKFDASDQNNEEKNEREAR